MEVINGRWAFRYYWVGVIQFIDITGKLYKRTLNFFYLKVPDEK